MVIQHITMPQLGESVTEGTIEKWLVQPGDSVNKYEALAEVTTDKVSAEIPSSYTGIIQELMAKEGQTLQVGSLICTIEVAEKEEGTYSTQPKLPLVHAEEKKDGPQVISSTQQEPYSNQGQKMRYSPAVLKLAEEHHIPLHTVVGTGAEGRITRKDLLKIISEGSLHKDVPKEAQSNSTTMYEIPKTTKTNNERAISSTPGDIEIPVTSIRKTIAHNMVRSKQEVPHAWMMMEVDVTDLVAYRDSIKDSFKAREGFGITYFPFFVKAVAQALKEYPMVNSMWASDKIIQKKDINLSIAVATENALFAPVIKQVDERTIKGIARAIHELSIKARTGHLSMADLEGGTFTVNNTGSFGSIQSMGIINHPQAAILQVEKIVKKPVFMPNGMFAARDIVHLCLSLDHRILDGLICGNFLNRVKDILEKTNYQTISIY